MKYERPYGDNRDVQPIRDGASLPKLFALVNQAAPNRRGDRLALLRWSIFQVLIGNTDATAKIYRFSRTPAG
jgi:serine/threonine-protein kinase HipA